MNLSDVRRIVKDISYKNWKFYLEERKDCFVLQIRFMAVDTLTGRLKPQHCRKWFVSSHACRAEVVRTTFKAVLAAEEHEAAENFLYRGVPIHTPHLDPDALARFGVYHPLNKRKKQRVS